MRGLLAIFCSLLLCVGTASAERVGSQPSPGSALGGLTGTPASVDEVLSCLLGPDVVATNVSVTAAPRAIGTFTGGGAVIGFEDGIVLSTGDVSFIAGPNMADNTSMDNGFPGDGDLEALIPGFTTFDATVLEFEFECTEPSEISFSYVFASEEYNEYVNSSFNDVFAFFLNGTAVGNNIATVPAACSSPGIPVTIDNVNCSNPYLPPTGVNCNCYRNNDLDDGGGAIATEMDGLTEVFVTTATINPGLNSIKLAIADAGDGVWDSNVFIRCSSFSCKAPAETGACCLPDMQGCLVTSQADCNAAGGMYIGDGTLCDPDPCQATPTEQRSWGEIKSTYK